MPQIDRPWWQTATVYQVYPRSFRDGNGDGVGDLAGTVAGLDHLAWLGVDAVWLSPFYRSPMRDFGYDIADHCAVDPVFGTLDDFDRLVAEAHRRKLRVILDYVPNHTAEEHPWFVDARSSRSSPRRDWYIWADARPDGSPPSNWQSNTGGAAWAWDAASGQYFMHSFLPFQPDLNWRNGEVRAAMLDVLRFWLDRGVDGFRIDMMEFLIKDALLRDDPPAAGYRPDPTKPWYTSWYSLDHVHSCNRPETHGIVREMRRLVDAYGGERVLIGEIDFHLPLPARHAFYGVAGEPELHLPFNFDLIATAWRADAVRGTVERIERDLPDGAWPNWVLGNHDVPRVASRVGPSQDRLAAVLLLTLRGTPFIYYGDEIGMRNGCVPADRALDPWEARHPGAGRDPARTPMQWSAEPHGGFSTVAPWLPVGADLDRCNVEAQRAEPGSLLHLYRSLLALRRASSALTVGAIEFLGPPDPDCLLYRRRHGGEEALVALNFGRRAVPGLRLPAGDPWVVRLSTHRDREEGPAAALDLRPGEGVVLGRGGNAPDHAVD